MLRQEEREEQRVLEETQAHESAKNDKRGGSWLGKERNSVLMIGMVLVVSFMALDTLIPMVRLAMTKSLALATVLVEEAEVMSSLLYLALATLA
jgi:hypothetical protein